MKTERGRAVRMSQTKRSADLRRRRRTSEDPDRTDGGPRPDTAIRAAEAGRQGSGGRPEPVRAFALRQRTPERNEAVVDGLSAKPCGGTQLRGQVKHGSDAAFICTPHRTRPTTTCTRRLPTSLEKSADDGDSNGN